ncbi:MAG: hypothetical protein WDZ35_05325 [Crocinitomicaceae bacterium]
MTEENKHMDDAFKRMSEELNSEQYKVPYNAMFWNEAKAKLEDEQLDNAFRKAAEKVTVVPGVEASFSAVNDVFMDSAFVDAAAAKNVKYDASYFQDFLAEEGNLFMDESFTEAASASVVDYLPEYWPDADTALKNEGLHHEYKSAYWDEARSLLDRSDRRKFFFKWSAVATILLLITFTAPAWLEKESALEMGVSQQISAQNEMIIKHGAAVENVLSVKDENNGLMIHEIDVAKSIQETTEIKRNFSQDLISTTINANQQNTVQIDPLNSTFTDDLTQINSTDELSVLNLPEISEEKKSLHDWDITNVRDAQTIKKLKPTGSQKIAMAMPDIELSKPRSYQVHQLSLIAAAGIGNKWGDFDFVPTMRSAIGVEYMVASGKHLKQLEFGGSFMVNHVKQSKLGYEDRSVVYDLSGGHSKKYWSKLQLKDMFYANLNILANYRLAPKHKLQIGVGFEQLIGVRSNMSFMNNNQNIISTINNNWGVKEGINTIDFRFSLGYEYQFLPQFSVRVNSQFGLLDRTDNDFFGDQQKDSEIGLTVGLKYNFLRRMK